MPASSVIRTAAGGQLRMDITPADVLDRCEPCQKPFREGDWYCNHRAAVHGHIIALPSDRDSIPSADTPVPPATAPS